MHIPRIQEYKNNINVSQSMVEKPKTLKEPYSSLQKKEDIEFSSNARENMSFSNQFHRYEFENKSGTSSESEGTNNF